jgi:glutaredoxin
MEDEEMIKLYVVKGCPACAKAREYLKKKGVKFKELNVEDNVEEVVRLTGSKRVQIPIICSSGKKCEIGFSERAFDKMIKSD